MSDLALDLGSSTTRVADGDGRVVYEEPTLAAVDTDSGRLLAFGSEAVGLGAQCAGRVSLVAPVRNGKLVDVDLAELVVHDVLRSAGSGRLDRPRVVVCAHVASTAVQDRAIERALKRAGARQVRFIEHPLAVALGADVPIAEAVGQMVVSLGGGTTDVGIIALGGLVTSAAVAQGLSDIDEALRAHLARHHGLVVERDTPPAVRRQLSPPHAEQALEISGRDTASGRPGRVTVRRAELVTVMNRVLQQIFEAVARAITEAPPDLANDLLGSGIVLAGGGAFLEGFARGLAAATGVPVHVPNEPLRVAVVGAARSEPGERTLALSARFAS